MGDAKITNLNHARTDGGKTGRIHGSQVCAVSPPAQLWPQPIGRSPLAVAHGPSLGPSLDPSPNLTLLQLSPILTTT